MVQRQLPDLDAGLFGLMQPLRRQADIVLRQCHFIQTHFTQTQFIQTQFIQTTASY
jgi:hypothetical protein